MSEDSGAGQQAEARAKEMGWVPQDQFKGDPAKWVPAEQFVERGEQILPILRKTNEGLHRDLTNIRGELNSTANALRESQETIKSLTAFQEEITADRVKAAREKLLTEMKAAKKEGDTDAEVELTDELTRLNAAEAATKKEAPKAADPSRQPIDPRQSPEFQSWFADNREMMASNPRLTRMVQVIAAEMREAGDTRVGRPFLDAAMAEARVSIGERTPAGGKVEAGGAHSGGGAGGGGSGRSYADLPREAKETIERQASRMVGENRAFKDMKGWQDHYAKVFFAGE